MNKKLKICGIKTLETLNACIKLDIGFIGFNFVPHSPRFISLDDALRLKKYIPSSIAVVGLTSDSSYQDIDNIITTLNPAYLQCHGHESPQRLKEIKEKYGVKIIKAIGIKNKQDVENALFYMNYADIILFDAKPSQKDNIMGGHGRKFNWDVLKEAQNISVPIMLAGGLNYNNLRSAYEETNVEYYDICSGVENVRGEKSVVLINDLEKIFKAINS